MPGITLRTPWHLTTHPTKKKTLARLQGGRAGVNPWGAGNKKGETAPQGHAYPEDRRAGDMVSYPAPMDEYLHTWLRELAAEGRPPNTLAAYQTDLRAAFRTLPKGPGAIRRVHLSAHVGRMKARGLSERTIARSVSTLRTFFAWLHEQGVIRANLADHLERPSVSNVTVRGRGRRKIAPA